MTTYWVFSTANLDYLPRLLQLDSSLKVANGTLRKVYLSLDNANFARLSGNFKADILVNRSELESADSALAESLHDRTLVEQFFTLGPSLLRHFLSAADTGDWLIYCDSDLFFYAPLDEILAPFEENSVVIVPHRHYMWNRRRLEKFGTFNVGMVAFRNCAEGRLLLNLWADRCIDWCKDFPQEGKYADQKYLEEFLEVGSRVAIDSRVGSNLAPWNSSLRHVGEARDGSLTVSKQRLLYFHMQGMKRLDRGWMLGHVPYLSIASSRLKRLIYLPYLRGLEIQTQAVNGFLPRAEGIRRGRSSFSYWLLRISNVLLGQIISFRDLER